MRRGGASYPRTAVCRPAAAAGLHRPSNLPGRAGPGQSDRARREPARGVRGRDGAAGPDPRGRSCRVRSALPARSEAALTFSSFGVLRPFPCTCPSRPPSRPLAPSPAHCTAGSTRPVLLPLLSQKTRAPSPGLGLNIPSSQPPTFSCRPHIRRGSKHERISPNVAALQSLSASASAAVDVLMLRGSQAPETRLATRRSRHCRPRRHR